MWVNCEDQRKAVDRTFSSVQQRALHPQPDFQRRFSLGHLCAPGEPGDWVWLVTALSLCAPSSLVLLGVPCSGPTEVGIVHPGGCIDEETLGVEETCPGPYSWCLMSFLDSSICQAPTPHIPQETVPWGLGEPTEVLRTLAQFLGTAPQEVGALRQAAVGKHTRKWSVGRAVQPSAQVPPLVISECDGVG